MGPEKVRLFVHRDADEVNVGCGASIFVLRVVCCMLYCILYTLCPGRFATKCNRDK